MVGWICAVYIWFGSERQGFMKKHQYWASLFLFECKYFNINIELIYIQSGHNNNTRHTFKWTNITNTKIIKKVKKRMPSSQNKWRKNRLKWTNNILINLLKEVNIKIVDKWDKLKIISSSKIRKNDSNIYTKMDINFDSKILTFHAWSCWPVEDISLIKLEWNKTIQSLKK